MDTAPVTVRGPHATTRSGQVTFARIFTHDGRLFVAEGQQRGARVLTVTEYPAPEGAPEPDRRRSKGMSWGPWSWDSCGCASSWRKHKVENLVAMSTPSSAMLVDPAGEPAESDPESDEA